LVAFLPFVVLDTLGELVADGDRIGGYCLAWRRSFAASLTGLIIERG
jgi:hypothetical protein